jgi:acetyl-CoA carboxylase carboxyl transferase subunit alpha
MRITAADLLELRVIDRIIAEPVGGAHRDPADAIARVGEALAEELAALAGLSGDELRRRRRAKYLEIE